MILSDKICNRFYRHFFLRRNYGCLWSIFSFLNYKNTECKALLVFSKRKQAELLFLQVVRFIVSKMDWFMIHSFNSSFRDLRKVKKYSKINSLYYPL